MSTAASSDARIKRVEVTDEYRSVGDGRALAFRRSFDEISFVADATVPREGTDPLFDTLYATGPLRGTSVVFAWQPDEQQYGKYYDAEEADEEYLADLASDMDLLCLLPKGDVSAGDEWRIQPAALRDVLAAGGRMPLRYQRTGNVMLGISRQIRMVSPVTSTNRISRAGTLTTRNTSKPSCKAPACTA